MRRRDERGVPGDLEQDELEIRARGRRRGLGVWAGLLLGVARRKQTIRPNACMQISRKRTHALPLQSRLY